MGPLRRTLPHVIPEMFSKKADLSEDKNLRSISSAALMSGSVNKGTTYAKLLRQPEEVGMVETQAPCSIVSDCDSVYAKAKAAGAGIVMEIADIGYGKRAFARRDPEGRPWNAGSYDSVVGPRLTKASVVGGATSIAGAGGI